MILWLSRSQILASRRRAEDTAASLAAVLGGPDRAVFAGT